MYYPPSLWKRPCVLSCETCTRKAYISYTTLWCLFFLFSICFFLCDFILCYDSKCLGDQHNVCDIERITTAFLATLFKMFTATNKLKACEQLLWHLYNLYLKHFRVESNKKNIMELMPHVIIVQLWAVAPGIFCGVCMM